MGEREKRVNSTDHDRTEIVGAGDGCQGAMIIETNCGGMMGEAGKSAGQALPNRYRQARHANACLTA